MNARITTLADAAQHIAGLATIYLETTRATLDEALDATMTLCDLHAQESAHWATSLQEVCSAFTPRETVGSRLAAARPGGEARELVRAQRSDVEKRAYEVLEKLKEMLGSDAVSDGEVARWLAKAIGDES